MHSVDLVLTSRVALTALPNQTELRTRNHSTWLSSQDPVPDLRELIVLIFTRPGSRKLETVLNGGCSPAVPAGSVPVPLVFGTENVDSPAMPPVVLQSHSNAFGLSTVSVPRYGDGTRKYSKMFAIPGALPGVSSELKKLIKCPNATRFTPLTSSLYGLPPVVKVVTSRASRLEAQAGTSINSDTLAYGLLFHVSQGNGALELSGDPA